jgi:hypothetical protein
MNMEPLTKKYGRTAIEGRTRSARRSLLGALAVGLVLSSIAQTNTTNSAASGNQWPTFESFSAIQRNNIFDPNRRPWFPRQSDNLRRPAIDAFALKGTMSYAKGKFAFFDGTSEQYNKVLAVGGNIAGYTVKEIEQNYVTLAANGKDFQMPVGRQVRKQSGNWQMGRPIEATNDEASADETTDATNANDPSAPPAAANAQMAEVLKRLMAAKEQELKENK